MRRFLVPCCFVLSAWVFCPLIPAQDISSDTLEMDRPIQKEEAPQLDMDQLKSLQLFLSVGVHGATESKLDARDFDRLFQALEFAPDSSHLLRVLLLEIKKDKNIQAHVDRLVKLAKNKPGNAVLALVAGDLCTGQKKLDDAISLYADCWNALAQNPEINKSGSVTQKQGAVLLSRLIQLNLEKKDFQTAEGYVEIAEGHPAMRQDARTSQTVFLFHAMRWVSDQSAPTPMPVPIPTTSLRLRIAADAAAKNYLDCALKANPGEKLNVEPFPAIQPLRLLGKMEELKQLLLYAIADNPQNVMLRVELAMTYLNGKEYANSARTWKQVLERGGQEIPWEYYYYYGVALEKSKQYQEAINTYELALLVNPDNQQVMLMIVGCWLALERPDRAFNRLKRLPDGFTKFYHQSRCRYQQKQFAEAQELLDRAIRAGRESNMNLDFRQLAFLYSLYAERNKDIAGIERVLRPLLAEHPDDAEILNTLGYSLADANVKLEEAETMIRKAIALSPEKTEILDSMAWILFRLKKFQEAEEWMQKCMDSVSKKGEQPDGVILDHAGDIAHALNKQDAARVFWEQALQSEDSSLDQDVIRKKLDSLPKK